MIKRFLSAILGFFVVSACGTSLFFWRLSAAYEGRIKAKLEQATKSIPHILGNEYFDKIQDKNSVPDEEYQKVFNRLESYVNDIGEIIFIYAYTLDKDRLVEVADTPSAIERIEKAPFFSEFRSAPMELIEMLRDENAPASKLVRSSDEYGDFVSYFALYRNKAGKRFLLGADIELSREKQRLKELFYLSLGLSIGSGIVFIFISFKIKESRRNFAFLIVLLTVFVPLWLVSRAEYQKRISDSLFMAARTIPEILGEKYIDRAKSPESVSDKEFRTIIQKINSFTKDVGITYGFALRRSANKIVYIADSTTEAELAEGFFAGYWGAYDTSPNLILPLFEEPGRIEGYYQDEYGSFRSVFFSRLDSQGDIVLFGADQQQNNVLITEIINLTLGLFLVILWGGLLKLWSYFSLRKINVTVQVPKHKAYQRLFWKTAFISSTGIILFLGIFYIYTQRLLYNSYSELEANELQNQIDRFKLLIEEEKKYVARRFADWAAWDDAYRFVQDGNSEFSKINLIVPTLMSLEVNVLMYLDLNKNLVGGNAYDTSTQKATPELVNKFVPYLQQHPRFFSFENISNRLSSVGLMSLPEGNFLLSVAPVVRSDLSGDVKGFLVVGRKIDREFINNVARHQNLNLQVYQINDAKKIDRFEPIIKSILANNQDVILPGSINFTYGYTILRDIDNQPITFVRLVARREIFSTGKDIIDRTLLLALISFGIIILVTNLIVLQVTVLARLLRLVDNLNEQQEKATDRFEPLPNSGNDEISYLIQTFNQLLEVNRKNNEKFIKIFRASPFAIMIVRATDGKILDVNFGFEQLFGYSTKEALDLNIEEFGGWLLGADGNKILGNSESNNFLRNVEIVIHNRFGQEIPCSLSTEIITIDQTTCLLYNIVDISKIKQLSSSILRLNSLLQAQQETSIEGILATDEQGKVVSFNQRFCQMWYLNPVILKDRLIHELMDEPEILEQLKQEIERAFNIDSGTYSDEVPLPDGRVFDVRAQGIYSFDKAYFGQIWYFRDITSLVTIEEQLFAQYKEIAQANAEIANLNERLKAENLRMSAELNIARHLQKMILPKPKELRRFYDIDIAAFMEPAEEVGGDYYDFFSFDRSAYLMIGDITGHGLDSGIIMLMVQTAITTLVQIGFQPHEIIATLNEVLLKNLDRMESDKSLTLAILSWQEGKIRITGQHEELLVLRHNGFVERIDTTELGFPIGLVSDISPFLSYAEIELLPGETAILFTDGVTEAEDRNRNFYGIDRLCKVALKYKNQSSHAICDGIMTDIRHHRGEKAVLDDITLIVIKQKCDYG